MAESQFFSRCFTNSVKFKTQTRMFVMLKKKRNVKVGLRTKSFRKIEKQNLAVKKQL